jgi:hypothetical protein
VTRMVVPPPPSELTTRAPRQQLLHYQAVSGAILCFTTRPAERGQKYRWAQWPASADRPRVKSVLLWGPIALRMLLEPCAAHELAAYFAGSACGLAELQLAPDAPLAAGSLFRPLGTFRLQPIRRPTQQGDRVRRRR